MASVIWLTGISGSGKTTLGGFLRKELAARHKKVEFLDGDSVRDFFNDNLGFTREERISNVKRIAFAAMLTARNGTHTIVANIAPYYSVRDFIRSHVKDYIQIYLKIPVEKAMERDVKGHYRAFKQGKMTNLIGVDEPYDVPRRPDLVLETGSETVEKSLIRILDYLGKRGI